MSVTSGAPTAASGKHVGRAMRRKEDPRMITGRARYIDDITVPGTLYAAIVRSPEAHATIASIDASAAAARDDVVAVFTGDDLTAEFAANRIVSSRPGKRASRSSRRSVFRRDVPCWRWWMMPASRSTLK